LGFFLEKRTPQRIALELPYLSDTKKIYFTGPPARFIRKLLNSRPGEKTPLIEREIRNNAHDRNVGLEILDSINFPRDKAVFLSPDFYMAVWEKILGFGHTGAVLPSTGMLAIEYILHSREYAGYKVYITGFGHKGWKGHAWALEKKLFDQYIDEKKLLPVPGPENS